MTTLTDREFMERVSKLYALGPEGLPELRELLRNGNLKRLITIAERGIRARPKRSAETNSRTRIPDEFPDEVEKQRAILYWQQHRRPDLVQAIAQIAEDFYDYHYSRGNMMVSWPVAWRTWYRNQIEFRQPPRNGELFVAQTIFEQTNVAGWVSRLELFYEDGTWSPKWGGKPAAVPMGPLPADCRCPPEAMKVYCEGRRRGA